VIIETIPIEKIGRRMMEIDEHYRDVRDGKTLRASKLLSYEAHNNQSL